MTESTVPKSVEDMQLLGQVLTANAKWSQDISNRVEENLQRDAKEWRDAFVKLWDAIEGANEKVDSMRINLCLDSVYHLRRNASTPFYWEKENH